MPPLRQGEEDRFQAPAAVGEPVLHARRDLGLGVPGEHTVGLEVAEPVGERLGADARQWRDVSFSGTDIVRVVDGRITEIRHVEQLLQLQARIAG